MGAEPESLEGWVPVIDDSTTIERVVELAFDYRGDVTVDLKDGSAMTGYVFNRDAGAKEPFLQMVLPDVDDQLTVPYAQIANIRFTGKDPAAGKSYAAWIAKREEARSE